MAKKNKAEVVHNSGADKRASERANTKLVHKKSIIIDNAADKKRPKEANIYDVINFEAQLYRVSQNIQNLRTATLQAEAIQFPQRYDLYRVYVDAVLDCHLSGVINNYKNLVMSREFNFYKKDGTINEETSKLLKTKWFRDFVSLSLDSRFWGFSVIQLGDVVENGFRSATLIPRIYVKPEYHLVTDTYTGFVGKDYRSDPYCNWVIPVGEDKDLGWLLKLSYHAIWKKTALGAWAEYAQIFGVPTRILQTNTKDPETMKAADKMMKSWGASQYLITNGQDKLDIREAQRTDAYRVFQELGKMCDEQMSKLVLGGTGTMEEKAHVGATSAHEKQQDRVKHDATFFIEDIIERQLKPLLIYHGFPVGDEICKITDNTDVAIENKVQIDLALIASPQYKLSAEYIKEAYGSDVENITPATPNEKDKKEKSLQNYLRNFYGIRGPM
jgi:hypothetical protein